MRDGNTTLTISIPASLKKKIKKVADREHCPMSNMIRVLMQEVLDNDLGVFSSDGKTYHGSHPLYRELGPLGESLGLEWGGRWKFVDNPHDQFRPEWARGLAEREFLASLRSRLEAKRDLLV